eukprot:551436_1
MNSKFMTKISVTNISETYYSFGQEYKYTKSLQQHPFYVKPKYNTLKEELLDCFEILNSEQDNMTLLQNQIGIIQTFNSNLHTILLSLVQQQKNKIESNGNSLWVDDNECKYYNT